MIPADMLMDCPVIWAAARITRIIQALWIPLGERVVAGSGFVETAMVVVILAGGLCLLISF